MEGPAIRGDRIVPKHGVSAEGLVERPARPTLGGVARSLVIVGGATAIGQAALLLVAPVLSRLYDPQAFGILSVYAAILSVLVAVASFRFDFAIPIADDITEAVHLVVLCVLIGLGMSAVAGIIVVIWGTDVAAALGSVSVAPFLWLIPIALFVASTTQALASWATYQRMFPALAGMRAVQGVTQAAVQTVLGLFQAGPMGLLLGDLAGRTFGAERLLRSALVSLRSTPVSLEALWQYARARWGFARVMTAASLLSAISLQLPFLVIPALFDLDSAGQYFLAYRVLVMPASLVAAAVSQVFFGEASARRADPQRLHDLALDAAGALLVFSIPTYAIVAVVGPQLFVALLGPQWAEAGELAQIMAPWLLVWSVANPISSLLLIGRRERESLAFTAVGLVLQAAALMVGGALDSLTAGVVALTVVSILVNVAALWRFLRVASVRLRDLGRPALRIVLLSIPSICLVILLGGGGPLLVIVAAACGWLLAIGLAARYSPGLRALVSGAHD